MYLIVKYSFKDNYLFNIHRFYFEMQEIKSIFNILIFMTVIYTSLRKWCFVGFFFPTLWDCCHFLVPIKEFSSKNYRNLYTTSQLRLENFHHTSISEYGLVTMYLRKAFWFKMLSTYWTIHGINIHYEIKCINEDKDYVQIMKVFLWIPNI